MSPAAGSGSGSGSLFVKGVDGEKIAFRHVAGAGYLLHTFDGTWQRIEVVETATGTARFFEFGLRGGFGTSDTVTFHAWGGQIEAGDDITSYVPTGEFSATRDTDSAILDGLAFGTCTVLIDATLMTGAADSEKGRRAFAALYSGSGVNDNVTIVNNDAGGLGSVVTAADALSGGSTTTAVAATGDLQSIALRIAADDTQMIRNGVLGNWLFDGPIPASMTRLHVGGSLLSTLARLGGVIHKITIVPFALTDSEMLVLTGGDAYPAGDVTWLRATKAAAFSPRDSAETFKLGGYQFIANGFQPVGVEEEQARHDLWRSVNGVDLELVNDAPEYDKFSKVVALDGVIYAWRAKMFKSVDGGASFTQIMATLPWGVSAFDNPALVHEGKLLFFHGTGNDPVEGTEGVWQFDPVAVEWTLICPAPWGARSVAVIAQFNGDLYLCGGQRNVANIPAEVTYPNKTTLNDIWKSTDGGETWIQTVAELPLAPRMWPAFIAYAGRLYLMGGYDNIGPANRNYADTWGSEDGASWSRLYATRDYLQRHAPIAYVVNAELFLTSGNANAAAPGSVLNDIWKMGL